MVWMAVLVGYGKIQATRTIITDIGTPFGLAFVDSTLYSTDDTDNQLVSINTTTGAHTDIFALAFNNVQPRGLTSDGTLFYISNDGVSYKLVYKWTIEGVTTGNWASPDTMPRDLTYDGTYLWLVGGTNQKIYQLDPSDGSEITSFASPGILPTGLAWDGANLWNYDANDQKMYLLDSTDGSVITSFSETDTGITGLVVSGGFLYAISQSTKNLYKYQL